MEDGFGTLRTVSNAARAWKFDMGTTKSTTGIVRRVINDGFDLANRRLSGNLITASGDC